MSCGCVLVGSERFGTREVARRTNKNLLCLDVSFWPVLLSFSSVVRLDLWAAADPVSDRPWIYFFRLSHA